MIIIMLIYKKRGLQPSSICRSSYHRVKIKQKKTKICIVLQSVVIFFFRQYIIIIIKSGSDPHLSLSLSLFLPPYLSLSLPPPPISLSLSLSPHSFLSSIASGKSFRLSVQSCCWQGFGLVSLFNGISTLFRLFNAKAILLEEQ